MKKKLSSILGVSLALVLAFTLVGGFVPANTPEAEAATAFVPNRWNTMPIPGAGGRQIVSGSNVTDFAVHPDGLAIYLINNAGALGNQIARSTNGGLSFAWIPNPTAAAGWGAANVPKLVAVAPDDPETFAVVENVPGGNADRVWISETGGSTWTNLGAPAAGGTAEWISDIAVSPLRAGCILDREYVVCTYDTTTNLAQAVGIWGDIYVVGASTTWAGLSAAQGIGYDFTSLALAPSWVGERVIVAIGSDNVAAGNTEVPAAGTAGHGDTYMVPISANALSLGLKGPGVVNMDTLTHDSPGEVCAGGLGGNPSAIWSSSATLPSDFDSYSVGNFRVYLGWASTPTGTIITNGDDVYRVDFSSPKKLEIAPVKAIESVSYWGTVQEGTLFAGEKDSTQVRYTSDPMSGMPTWAFSYKPPTCSTVPLQCTNTINAKVAVASNFGETNTAWGGCTGNDSAFSISYDGGASFNGKTFIDEEAASTLITIRDVMPSPDGSYVFMATEDAVSGDHSLWRSDGDPSAGSWWRVGFRTAAQFTGAGTIVRLSPDDDAVYWFDQGALAGTLIRRSTTNGQIWGTRTAGATLLTDAVIESQDVVYMISGANVQKSINGAKSFGLPVNASLGPLADIAMCPSYPLKPVEGNVIVGADGTAAPGGVALSTDANATWPALLAFTGTGAMQVLADKGYDGPDGENADILYAGSATAGEGIYRYEIGYSTSWENIRTPAAGTEVMTGLAGHCGLLYGAWDVPGVPYSGAERALAPMIAVASMPPWGTMDMPAAIMGTALAAGADINTAPNALRTCGTDTEAWLFAINTSGNDTLLGYIDDMAKLTPVLDIPSLIPANPVNGMNEQFFIVWPQVSNANEFLVRIYADEATTEAVYVPAQAGVSEPGAPKWLVPRNSLIGGVYWAKVLATDQVPGDAIWSNFSPKFKFSVEVGLPIEVPYGGPQLMGPLPGATDVSAMPGFGWAALYGAEKYEFELSASPETTARGYFIDALVGLTGENALVTTAWQCTVSLDYETNYYWHVKAITATSESPWSTAVFTTISEAAVPVPPVPPVELPAPITPAWIWAIVVIGAILVIVVIALIFMTRKP